jgi:hypothetical protein
VPRSWNPHPAISRINGVRATFLRAPFITPPR